MAVTPIITEHSDSKLIKTVIAQRTITGRRCPKGIGTRRRAGQAD
jgi:hypothetical protein